MRAEREVGGRERGGERENRGDGGFVGVNVGKVNIKMVNYH